MRFFKDNITPGTYNPFESLPTRLGLSRRTLDQQTQAGGFPLGTTLVVPTPTPVSRPSTSHEPKPAYHDIFDAVMRDEEAAAVERSEEPQDLSLHQLPTQGWIYKFFSSSSYEFILQFNFRRQ